MLENIIGIVAGVLTGISMLPQLVKMIKEKEGKDISAGMLIVLLAGLAVWVAYGIMKKDWPIIITNAFSFLVNSIIITLKFVYERKR
ncbi:MAG TPA: SemiSWEET transporter [Flavipsychrobacter sp.]|nr:SemiSWEET transporter [Flavipsychrobacter sp.]